MGQNIATKSEVRCQWQLTPMYFRSRYGSLRIHVNKEVGGWVMKNIL